MIELTLPIYYYDGTKLNLIGINKYERMHHIIRNKLKQTYYKIVRAEVGRQPAISGAYEAHYKLYYKNKLSDAPNIISVIDKLTMDALQGYGRIEQDNMLYYVKQTWEVAGQDKDKPRVEVEVKELTII